MNILHVITGLPKAAGTTTFVENVVHEQRALGHTVEVLTNENVHQLTTNPQPLTPNPSLIHIHGLWSPLLHKAARFARKNKIPVVWSTHGMTAPWSLHHKWWKKCLPWYLYQKPDLRSAALIHCTTDLEADWNRALGFSNVFVAPLGTNLPAAVEGVRGQGLGVSGRGGCPRICRGGAELAKQVARAVPPAIDASTNDALNRDFDRRAMAESKENPPPEFRPLTEVVEAVAKHQAAGFSPSTTEGNIANPSSPRKGENNNSTLHLHSTPTPKQQRTLLYVGRIYPVKALDNAIRAVALMKQPIILRIVGPDQSGHMAELMSLCDSLHLPYTKPGEDPSALHLHSTPTPKQVQFVGPKYDSDLDQEYWTCDALILVSHTENFGATVVDALAHAKPVITSTNTPWSIVQGKSVNSTLQLQLDTPTKQVPNPQPLTPNPSASGRCGWWVDNSPESLANTFSQLLTLSPSHLRAMGANGLALVKQSYTWPAIAKNLIKRYEGLGVRS